MVNLIYNLTAAKPEDSDVVSRQLEVYINGVRTSTKLYDANTISFDPVVASHGDDIKVYLYDIDHVDNRSEPAIIQFVARDTIPPKTPKDFEYSLSDQTSIYISALKKN